MKGYCESDIKSLIKMAEEAKSRGQSMCSVFQSFAKLSGRAAGSVRNMYYRILSDAKKNSSFKKKYLSASTLSAAKIVAFDKIEERNLIKKIILGKTFGKSVRRVILEIAKYDEKLTLRYQNKFRNAVRTDKELIEDVMAEIKTEYGKCFNPYDSIKTSGYTSIKQLKAEIDGLADRLKDGLRTENGILRDKLKIITAENERLSKLVAERDSTESVISGYFGKKSESKQKKR